MLIEFECKECKAVYERLVKFDKTGKYKNVQCDCGSKRKKRLLSSFVFNFSNPVGTSVWNKSHDYRYKTKLPKARAEREAAQKAAKEKTGFTSANPYHKIDDLNKNTFGEVK